jgi:glycosyltransferase involved in cell wall biosynthesis
MPKIILADDGITFDGDTLKKDPLGGAETAFISLAEALANRNHDVTIFNRCKISMKKNGVSWKPFELITSLDCDLYIANRGHTVLSLFPKAKSRIFWIHNPANYLLKWRYLSKIWWWKPTIIFSSNFHVRSYPNWAPSGRRMNIPYGISPGFLKTPALKIPPLPRVAFTSSPLRSLDWLLNIWASSIHPNLKNAELHIFSSPKTYGEHGNVRLDKMNVILNKALSMKNKGIILREPLPKDKLANELSKFRALLYKGDPGETYCLAVGESQAAGVPCVVKDVGCVAERVINGITGYVAKDDNTFINQALSILKDDKVWRSQHQAALIYQRKWNWDDASKLFEQLI